MRYVVEKDQCRASGVKPRRVMVIVKGSDPGLHGEREHMADGLLRVGCDVSSTERGAKRVRHLLRATRQSCGFFSHSTSPTPCRSFSSLASVNSRSESRFRYVITIPSTGSVVARCTTVRSARRQIVRDT